MKKITDYQLKLGIFILLIFSSFHSVATAPEFDDLVDGNGICPLPKKNEFSDSTGPPPSTCPVNPLYGQHLRVLVLEVSLRFSFLMDLIKLLNLLPSFRLY